MEPCLSTAFQPEYAGKMNFYLAVADDILRHPTDAPTIGLILCRDKKRMTVEYALRSTESPIGVANFTTALPADFVGSLPTIAQFEAELSDDFEDKQ
ncbi:MAG: DUF1016 family protein [Fibrella sp.]|nr:DUF1016 family protein [Armatimonadota bacterium]